MTASIGELLDAARLHRVAISLRGDNLHLAAPCKPPEDFLELITAHKLQILSWLGRKPVPSKPITRQTLMFTIDGYHRPISAIDMIATNRDEALERLLTAWGGRMLSVRDRSGRLIWERG